MPKRLLRARHKTLKRAGSNARSLELEKRRQELLRREWRQLLEPTRGYGARR